MLVQYSLSSSIEATMFCACDHGKQDLLCDWVPGAETWQMCPKGNDEFHGGCNCKKIELITEDRMTVDHLCPRNLPKASSQLSTISSMSRSSPLNFVYKRRKLRGNSIGSLPVQGQENARRSGHCFSNVSCNTSLVAALEQNVDHEIKSVGDHRLSPFLHSKFSNGCSVGEGLLDKAPKGSVEKTLEVESVNDNCSSSKSNAQHVLSFIKTEVDETSECSSSSTMVTEFKDEDLSESEFCIRILGRHGLLGKDWPKKTSAFSEDINTSNGDSCFWPCKICGHSETVTNLLICDHCEEAFHLSCCNPQIKKVPTDEWFCRSCVKKRCKILKEKVNRKLPNITTDDSQSKSLSTKGETNPMALMLRDTKSYTTGVRIGKDFQAEVPDWSGPIDHDDDGTGEPLEMDPSEFVSNNDLNANNYSRVSSVGNWLQCREVLDGGNRTICGKWRRAPFSEVQTDKWECYRCVLWDPTYADCAVPQEIVTDKVINQTKYIEKLRPRLYLSSGQQKSDHTEANGNSRNPTP